MTINLRQKRWNLPSSKLIKGQKFCWFRKDCNKCAHFKDCISPTGIAKEKYEYWAYCHGIKEPTTEAMRLGTERHRIYQENIPDVHEWGGPLAVQNSLIDGQFIQLKEAAVCSPFYGIHGFIDILEMQLKDDELFIKITDLKTGWLKKYIWQIGAYALVMEDPEFNILYQKPYKRKKGSRRLGMKLLPTNLEVKKNIKLSIYFFGSKNDLNWEWMVHNRKSDFGLGVTTQIKRRLMERRPLHKMGLLLPEDYNPERKDKQLFFGVSKLLKKTKPKVYHEPTYRV